MASCTLPRVDVIGKRGLREAKRPSWNSGEGSSRKGMGSILLITLQTWVFIFLIAMQVVISITDEEFQSDISDYSCQYRNPHLSPFITFFSYALLPCL